MESGLAKKTKNQAWNQPPTFGLGGGGVLSAPSQASHLCSATSGSSLYRLPGDLSRPQTSLSPSKASLRQREEERKPNTVQPVSPG